MTQSKEHQPRLLALPYDIRFLIYQHLFNACSQGEHIYIQARQKDIISTAEQKIPLHILAVSHQLYQDTGQYFYNHKIFNLVGSKDHCLSQYAKFRKIMARHATSEIHVDCFSNGQHSTTGCISMYSGDGKQAVLNRRDRGIQLTLDQLRVEVAQRKHAEWMEWWHWQYSWVAMSVARVLDNIPMFLLTLCVCFAVPLLDYTFEIGPSLDHYFARLYRSWAM